MGKGEQYLQVIFGESKHTHSKAIIKGNHYICHIHEPAPPYLCFVFIKAMITVTDIARAKIVELKNKEGITEAYKIRVAVKGGGCSGLMYDLDFDNQEFDTDRVFEDNGISIAVDKKSLLYLAGTALDFSDGLNGKGFQFVNPNANRTCGCGESFSI